MADISPEKIGVKTADANKVINQQNNVVSDAGGGAFKVEMSGGAGFKGNPNSVVQEFRTPNTDLATQIQIDNGTATYNSAANAWEVDVVPNFVTVIPPTTQQPSNLKVAQVNVNPGDLSTARPNLPVAPNVPNIPIVTAPPVVAPPVVAPPAVTTPPKDETVVPPVLPVAPVGDPNPNAVITPANPNTQPSNQQVANVDITKPAPVVTPTIPVTPPPLIPLVPTDVTPLPPVVNVDLTKPPVVEPPPPVEPIAPVEPPVTPPVVNVPNPPLVDETTPPTEDTYYGRYTWGTAPQVKIPGGLNPGFIEPPTYYQTTDPAQSKYYWGEHPYQPTQTFNKQLYNTLPNAPVSPWGLGKTQTAATREQILAAMQGLYPNLSTQTVTGPAVPVR
jgi:hypothetical protein